MSKDSPCGVTTATRGHMQWVKSTTCTLTTNTGVSSVRPNVSRTSGTEPTGKGKFMQWTPQSVQPTMFDDEDEVFDTNIKICEKCQATLTWTEETKCHLLGIPLVCDKCKEEL